MSIMRATNVPFRDEKAVSCSVGGTGLDGSMENTKSHLSVGIKGNLQGS